MANERLAQARDLIKAKRYQEARQVLKPIATHPTARTWLAKLDEIAPEVEDDPFADIAPARPKRRFSWLAAALLILVLIVFAGGVVWYVGVGLRGADAQIRRDSDAFSAQFILTLTPPTSAPYRELATQRPYPTDPPTSTPTAIPLPPQMLTPTAMPPGMNQR